MEFKRVLVGIDGSPAAEAAARWAARMVAADGEVIAVHATGTALIGQAAASAATGLGMFPHVASRKEEAQRVLDGWCVSFRDAGVNYRGIVSDFDPVRALLEIARREDADVIVIGHRGEHGFVHRLFQGLSDHLIDHAHKPVVVVPSV